MLATLVAENHEEFGTLVAIPIVNQWGSQPAGHAYEAFGRALTRRADGRTMTAEAKRTGVTYVDDRVQFGARNVLEAEIENFTQDARATIGVLAVNDAKTVLSTAFDTIGWRFKTIARTIAPSPCAARGWRTPSIACRRSGATSGWMNPTWAYGAQATSQAIRGNSVRLRPCLWLRRLR